MKFLSIKNILLSSSTLLLLTACSTSNINSSNNELIIDENHTQNSLDWDGYYYGTLPCASCPGIETWLILKENNNKITYELKEKYLEEKNALFVSKGNATWEKNGLILNLETKNGKEKKVFVGENYISLDTKNINSLYRLNKMKVYENKNSKLFLDSSKIKQLDNKINFVGIMNFTKQMQGGHKSLKADFILDCKKRIYSIPNISYFRNSFLTGELLDKTNKNNTTLAIKNEAIINQVANDYCQEK